MALKVITLVASWGYWGIGILMAIGSCNIPFASEVTLPFGGYLVSIGRLTFWGTVLAGTIGGTAGSLVSYYIGLYGGRPFLDRYGRYLGATPGRLALAEAWFARYDIFTVFFTRLLPVIRTFISLPAGVARVNIVHLHPLYLRRHPDLEHPPDLCRLRSGRALGGRSAPGSTASTWCCWPLSFCCWPAGPGAVGQDRQPSPRSRQWKRKTYGRGGPMNRGAARNCHEPRPLDTCPWLKTVV